MNPIVGLFSLIGYAASPGGLPSDFVDGKPQAVQMAAQKKPATTTNAKKQPTSPYSSNPEYDVFVNGEYVGSDPDPRVRSQLKREWKNNDKDRIRSR
ncbi:MAG: hypothetical protein WD073_09315 [Xanthobacteraceae bacterium]